MERKVAKKKRNEEKDAQIVPVKKKKTSIEEKWDKHKDQTKGKSTEDKGTDQ